MLNNILKFKIFFLKIYSFCNYKTNIFKFFSFLNKIKHYNFLNYINYFINFLNYKNKKNISINLYLKISNLISIINVKKYGFFFFSNKNIFLNKIIKNYEINDICYIIEFVKLNKIKFSLKILKKIFTRILFKINNDIYENLKERFLITALLNCINEKTEKIICVYKLLLNYNVYNFFFLNKNVKKACSIIYFNENENLTKKVYLGLVKSNYNDKTLFYLSYLFNYLIKYNKLKLDLSIDIYCIDLFKVIKMIKKIKKIKIFINIGINDLFFENFFKNKNWFLFDSVKVKKNICFYIQNFYDEYIGFGSFRKIYNKVIKNNNIFKTEINSRKLLFKILKIKNLKIIFLDTLNRNNINKHISALFSNFYHSKIFDKNNFFKKKYFFYNNNNILITKNNSFYLELKFYMNYSTCKFISKKFYLMYKLLDKNNENCILNKEIFFFLNYRIKPITIYINKTNNIINEYMYFISLNINCYLSKIYEPYSWFLDNEIDNKNFFYKKNFLTKKWNFLNEKIKLFQLKNSIYLNFKKKLNKKIISFDNYFLKLIIKNWQKQYEKY